MKKRYLSNVSVLGLLILLIVIISVGMELNKQSYWTMANNNDNVYPILANWTRGGISTNLTVIINVTGINNISEVNITVPTDFVIPNYLKKANKHSGMYNQTQKLTSRLKKGGGWNITLNSSQTIIRFNKTRSNGSNLTYGEVIRFFFNLTTKTPGTETPGNFSIVLKHHPGEAVLDNFSSYDFQTGGVDDLKPRLVNINISDGTHTVRDDLAKGDPASLNGTGWLNNN